ncbi:MAG TPA: hypothetical protein VGI96_22750 [Streptosporangiaceae bacterium]|jgi:hypothetical protein
MVIHQDQVTALHLTTGHRGPVTDDSSRAAWLSGARWYLRDADPVLARLIDDRPDFDPRAWISELPAMDQSWSFHDREDFYIRKRSKAFAIMKSLALVSQTEVTPVSADSIAPHARCFLE